MASFLVLRDVAKTYQSVLDGPPVTVLSGINLEIRKGESAAVVGPSGSGKSTLLNIIGTLDRPTSGRVFLDDQDLAQWDESQLAAARNRLIGFTFQAHHLLPQCTVLENVLVPTLVCEDEALRRSAPERACRLLERVGLKGRLHHRPGQLSGGERQRAAVVRGLINQPRLLLADEPTGALDHAAAEELARLLGELNREEGVTLLVATHSRELAQQMGRLFQLRDGHLESTSSSL
jgi:ABC-type lipoprotein export system ATPase subunit